jgi:hypothetical protein
MLMLSLVLRTPMATKVRFSKKMSTMSKKISGRIVRSVREGIGMRRTSTARGKGMTKEKMTERAKNRDLRRAKCQDLGTMMWCPMSIQVASQTNILPGAGRVGGC